MSEGRGVDKVKRATALSRGAPEAPLPRTFTHSATPNITVIAESVCECIVFLFFLLFLLSYLSFLFSTSFGGISLFYCFSRNNIMTQERRRNNNTKGRKKSNGFSMLSLHVDFFVCLFFYFNQIQVKSLHMPPGSSRSTPRDWGSFQTHILFSLNVCVWYHFVKTVWCQSCCRGVFVSSVRRNTLSKHSDTAPDWLRRARSLWNQKKSINSWLSELAPADLLRPASFCSRIVSIKRLCAWLWKRETAKQGASRNWTQRESRSRRRPRIEAGIDGRRGSLCFLLKHICQPYMRRGGLFWWIISLIKTVDAALEQVISWGEQLRIQKASTNNIKKTVNEWELELTDMDWLNTLCETTTTSTDSDWRRGSSDAPWTNWSQSPAEEPELTLRHTQHGIEKQEAPEPAEDGPTLLQLADWNTVSRFCRVTEKDGPRGN